MTPSELVLLGLLAERPRHGYELEEVITARGMREWTEIGFSSIYYVLGKLRERGLVSETAAPSARGKPRKVYEPTPAGLRELAKAAEAAVAQLRPVYPALLVGLANEPSIPRARLVAALQTRLHAIDERLAAVRAAATAQPGVPDFVTAIFDYSLGQLEAEKRWLENYLGGRTVPAYDVKKDLKPFYAPKNTDWEIVEVSPMRYIGIDGSGDPNTDKSYSDAVEALYTIAYTIKFAHKDRPFTVAPLEGLWWADDPSTFVARQKAAWKWTMLISQPPWITDADIESAKRTALAKKKLPAIERVRVVSLSEGPSAQLLHIGSYDDEGPKLARLHEEFMTRHGLDFNGRHHEIYISDPRRTEPAKLKTILRQPVKPN
ncbi:GyrI-like domain-containing protein [Allorhizocola rhizosphaerae]|uniref:GyrI-like domain-containing protein n=1 Tax=Allorhizocola rhizosphaerae TaxID=1872709 RepID=UPI000E3B631F|nr:GyrI-like domain-containing protein [Allorhizocola rhizosphaerae]